MIQGDARGPGRGGPTGAEDVPGVARHHVLDGRRAADRHGRLTWVAR